MADITRTPRSNPYADLPKRPTLEVTSTNFANDQALPWEHVHDSLGGGNHSPQLSWSGAPAETQSYAITCYDPDAPNVSRDTPTPMGMSQITFNTLARGYLLAWHEQT